MPKKEAQESLQTPPIEQSLHQIFYAILSKEHNNLLQLIAKEDSLDTQKLEERTFDAQNSAIKTLFSSRKTMPGMSKKNYDYNMYVKMLALMDTMRTTLNKIMQEKLDHKDIPKLYSQIKKLNKLIKKLDKKTSENTSQKEMIKNLKIQVEYMKASLKILADNQQDSMTHKKSYATTLHLIGGGLCNIAGIGLANEAQTMLGCCTKIYDRRAFVCKAFQIAKKNLMKKGIKNTKQTAFNKIKEILSKNKITTEINSLEDIETLLNSKESYLSESILEEILKEILGQENIDAVKILQETQKSINQTPKEDIEHITSIADTILSTPSDATKSQKKDDSKEKKLLVMQAFKASLLKKSKSEKEELLENLKHILNKQAKFQIKTLEDIEELLKNQSEEYLSDIVIKKMLIEVLASSTNALGFAEEIQDSLNDYASDRIADQLVKLLNNKSSSFEYSKQSGMHVGPSKIQETLGYSSPAMAITFAALLTVGVTSEVAALYLDRNLKKQQLRAIKKAKDKSHDEIVKELEQNLERGTELQLDSVTPSDYALLAKEQQTEI